MKLAARCDIEKYLNDSRYRDFLNSSFEHYLCPQLSPWYIYHTKEPNYSNGDKFLQMLPENKTVGSALLTRSRGYTLVEGKKYWKIGYVGVIENELRFNIEKAEQWFYKYLDISKRWNLDSWLVINEMLNEKGIPVKTRWGSWIPNLVEESYEVVKKNSPNSKLYLGDYGLKNTERWEHIYNEIIKYIQKGVSIEGVNLQVYTDLADNKLKQLGGIVSNFDWMPSYSIKFIEYWIKKFKDLGLLVQIECSIFSGSSYSELKQKAIGSLYKRYYRICKNSGVDTFIVWNPVDTNIGIWDHSRKSTEFCGWYDSDYQPKEFTRYIIK